MAPRSTRSDRQPAERLPVARVCVDVPLAHLDRPFDYLVDAADDEAAQPGVRVKVRFAGQLVGGWLLERAESSTHEKLAYLDKVVSPERVLDPEVARLARAVADRYAGNLADVLRLAVPPRHARVEAAPDKSDTTGLAGSPGPAEPDGSDKTEPHGPLGAAEPDGSDKSEQHGPPGATEPDGSGKSEQYGLPGPDQTDGSDKMEPHGLPSGRNLNKSDKAARAVGADKSVERSDSPVAEAYKTVLAASSGRDYPPDKSDMGVATASVDKSDLPGGGDVGGELTEASERALPGGGGIGWSAYLTGAAFLRALAAGRPARAVWAATPGEDWPARIAEAARASVGAGRGVVIVVADARDLDRVDRALAAVLGPGRHVALNAAAGPAERYRRFLKASRHRVPVVVGTRAAMFAPVGDLGLVVIWDDGDDLHAEPRAPYPHARDVLLTRARLADCAALVGGFARTGEAQLLLDTGWAHEIIASREVLRARSPRITPAGDDPELARDPGAATARLPSIAWQAARQSLQAGAPVLVQVPRRGYVPSVACAECRTPARCAHCSGPLALGGARDTPACRWCGRPAAAYTCPTCGARRLRASVTGSRRTAEELGRAFPGATVRTSGRDEVLDTVPAEPALVVATPGAEPVAEGGYGAVLLLDAWALLSRSDLRAAEEALRRWLNASALARPAAQGGTVVVVADGSLVPVQALLRWDPGWFAARELDERRELGFPPAARMASLTGRAEAVADLLAVARLPDATEQLGPVPAADDQERTLLRVSRSRAADLARALHAASGVRSARKAPLPVRVQVDPADLF